MSKTKADNRKRLLHAAEQATYLYGFGSTSIADIAKKARIPLGNVYYYFKTKDRSAAPSLICACRDSRSFSRRSARDPSPGDWPSIFYLRRRVHPSSDIPSRIRP